ncbi:MAG TPA: regulatory protein RecX [Prolixibacteraceae bacterium]|nr:regulatory protein RecX [Prolixibacteraceae bacterium]
MEGNINYRQALTKVMAMCSQSERCRFDIVAKLRQWELSEEEIAEAVDYLIKEHFLDEERFVRFFVNDKLRFNKWGKVKLRFILRQKQIPETIVREALDQINDDLYLKTLQSLLNTKVKSVKGASDYERKGKLAVFAQSHGFEAELAFRIAGELIRS